VIVKPYEKKGTHSFYSGSYRGDPTSGHYPINRIWVRHARISKMTQDYTRTSRGWARLYWC